MDQEILQKCHWWFWLQGEHKRILHRDVVAVPSVILVAKRAQVDPGGFVTKSLRIWPQKEHKWTKEVLQKCPRRF